MINSVSKWQTFPPKKKSLMPFKLAILIQNFREKKTGKIFLINGELQNPKSRIFVFQPHITLRVPYPYRLTRLHLNGAASHQGCLRKQHWIWGVGDVGDDHLPVVELLQHFSSPLSHVMFPPTFCETTSIFMSFFHATVFFFPSRAII